MLTNKQEIAFFSFLGFILLAFVVLIYLIGNRVGTAKNTPRVPNTPLPLGNIEIEAKSALVYDTVSGKTLFAKEPDTRLPLASLTKVMTALIARDIASQDSEVVVTAEAVREDGDAGLAVGERWRLRDLLDFSLVTSANDGMKAISLSYEDFISQMNVKASQIGMKNTYYVNDTGLDESEVQGGAYGSARDQALLLEHILRNYPDLLGATKVPSLSIRSLDGVLHIAKNTNLIVGDIPGLIASKTGFTDLAGGNLLIAFDPEVGRPIIISLLGSSEEGRFEDMKKLVQASLVSVENSVISTE
jgi:D-alanyl-D-alanine carboxypeptidase (penicillin-binding protein 5/6)